MDKVKMFDRISGAIFGVAVGDCLGAPAEFRSREEITRLFGTITDIVPGSVIGARLGCGTDDTAMTLAVAEGIMRCEPDENPVKKIGAEFIRWYCDDPVGLGGICGRSISIASDRGQKKSPSREDWLQAARATHALLNGRSAGNGTLMRTVPVALFYPYATRRDSVAGYVSRMTHFDSDAALACVLYCRIISELIRGESAETAQACLRYSTDYRVTVTDPKPTGYVKDSFKTALWGWRNNSTFEQTLIDIVNLGGDADTTGAIAGGLAGACYGYSAIPDRWINALDDRLKARLDAVAEAAGKVWKCWG